jgi:hypothetical protein
LPPAPSNLRPGATTSTIIELRWDDNAASETSQQVTHRPVAGGSWTVVTLGANVESWVHTPVAANSSFYYYVRACNAAGCSAWSNLRTGANGAAAMRVPRGRSSGEVTPPAAVSSPTPAGLADAGAPPPPATIDAPVADDRAPLPPTRR